MKDPATYLRGARIPLSSCENVCLVCECLVDSLVAAKCFMLESEVESEHGTWEKRKAGSRGHAGRAGVCCLLFLFEMHLKQRPPDTRQGRETSISPPSTGLTHTDARGRLQAQSCDYIRGETWCVVCEHKIPLQAEVCETKFDMM